MERAFGRSPTFLVGAASQRQNLDNLVRREEHLAEEYCKNKPLCFAAGAYQKTHPQKAQTGHRDADATVVSPMMLGVADGVSQVEEFGIDSSELPNELLQACERVANSELVPDKGGRLAGSYRGPIPLMKEAYDATESLGSTTVALAVLDNSTRIHGKLHPMIAVLSIGDCEVLILRQDRLTGQLFLCFQTEMQRIGGHCQCPLQLCRVDDRVDPDFDERIAHEVIQRGSAVHNVSVYEGDIVIIGSDGVFDNLFHEEVIQICASMLPPDRYGKSFVPTDTGLLGRIAQQIVHACHVKTQVGPDGRYPETPIGKGGKRDDTSCVVGEVIEWTQQHTEAWARKQSRQQWRDLLACGGLLAACYPDSTHQNGALCQALDESVVQNASFSKDASFASDDDEAEEEDARTCTIS